MRDLSSSNCNCNRCYQLRTMGSMGPQSCDTFVCLPPITGNGHIIFGKNSDRPAGEVQEIVYQPHEKHENGAKLRCTYIEIDQVAETTAMILSKPSWMWGAEMGANEHGVCIGNEAVWTKLNSDDDLVERLLGMDLVRLGLERSKTVREALDVITNLLSIHGQGGPCSDTMPDFTYHNSFLIAGRKEAWVLETTGKLWAAEHVTSGYRHISNELSIGTKIDLMSPGLKEEAVSLGYWKPTQEFHFAKIFASGGYHESGRVTGARRLVNKLSKDKAFDVKSMMEVLRDEKSGICMGYEDSFQSTSSQVSVLPPDDSSRPCTHWFTGTPDPSVSIFKPFMFSSDTISFTLTSDTRSPSVPESEGRSTRKSRISAPIDREHALYKTHKKFYYSKLARPGQECNALKESVRQIESTLIERMEKLFHQKATQADVEQTKTLNDIFNQSVESELKFYQENV